MEAFPGGQVSLYAELAKSCGYPIMCPGAKTIINLPRQFFYRVLPGLILQDNHEASPFLIRTMTGEISNARVTETFAFSVPYQLRNLSSQSMP